MPQGSSGGSQTAGRQDVLLPKPELKKGAKHLPGKTDVRGKLPQTPRNQLGWEWEWGVHLQSS